MLIGSFGFAEEKYRPRPPQQAAGRETPMRLADILSPECVKVPLESADKRGLIEEMVDLLDAAGVLTDRDQMLQATLQREATRTTGIGGGLAIPHGKCSAVSKLVMAVGKTAEPVDFEAIDGQPVTFVIYLASPPDKTGPHIQALARISRLTSDGGFRRALDAADSAEAVYDLFVNTAPED
jgi:mannitol/fructose-specific phosphotransferase system IIA component (Ntr-type)